MNVVEFGGRIIPVKSVAENFRDQTPPAIRQGPSARSDRQGVRGYKIQSLHKGLGVLRGSELNDNLRYRSSQGLWAHQPFGLFLPPVLTSQAALAAVDISGFRAANKRMHALNSTLGQSKLRFYLGVGKKFYRTTSDSNAALADSSLSLTDNITGMFEGKMNNTRYIFLTTDGDTDDCVAISDPTATGPTNTKAFAYTAGDWVGGGASLPNSGPGWNLWYGKIGGTTGLFYTLHSDAALTAPKPLVLTDTKDNINTSNATQNTGAVSPAEYASAGAMDGFSFSSTPWTDGANIGASDNTYAQCVVGAGEGEMIVSYNYGFDIPIGSSIVGVKVEVEKKESAAADDVYDIAAALTRGAQMTLLNSGDVIVSVIPVGTDKQSSTEWPTADAYTTYGGATDTWATALTPEIINSTAFGFGIAPEGRGVGGTAYIDHIRMTVYHRPPGTQAKIPLGGYVLGGDPLDPNVVYIVAPEFQDETTTVNVPRIVWRVETMWQPDQQRPTVTLSKVPTSMVHVESACFSLGGLVVSGDTKSGVGKKIRLIRPDGTGTDLGFNSTGQGYTEEWGVVNVWGADRILICDVALESATVVQTWLHFDGSWHPVSPRETITSLPLAYSRSDIGVELLQRYRLYPTTTNTTATRTFHPRSFLLDPLANNTTEVKADGVMTITLPEMDLLGPEESEKVMLTLWCLSRDVSASNTIRIRYSTDGGSTYTTATTFTSFGSKYTLTVPVAFRTVIIEIGLNHTASSAGTPNGLPILIEGAVRWTPQRQWTCDLEPDSPDFLDRFPGGIEDLWDTLAAMNTTEDLKIANGSAKAIWNGYKSIYVPPSSINALPERYLNSPRGGAGTQLVFDEVVQ